MHWPSRKPADSTEVAPPGGGGVASFSAPPPSDVPAASPAPNFSTPPPSTAPKRTDYESVDLSKYGSSVYESDGLQDQQYARREQSSVGGQWITHPRARQCINNIQLGAKMGASVGGCFGLLTGLVVGIQQRNILVLPVSVIGGAVSFGFFLGCGMIIRCEEKPGRLCDDAEHEALFWQPPASLLVSPLPAGITNSTNLILTGCPGGRDSGIRARACAAASAAIAAEEYVE